METYVVHIHPGYIDNAPDKPCTEIIIQGRAGWEDDDLEEVAEWVMQAVEQHSRH